MKNLGLKKGAIRLRVTKDVYKKMLTGISLSLFLQCGLTAQNASYNVNNVPVGGTNNAAFGPWCLVFTSTGSENVAVGNSVLGFNNGNGNTGTGYAALVKNTSGTENCAFGTNSMYWNTTGSYNVAVGPYAMYNNTTGQENVAVGLGALGDNTGGYYNVAMGDAAMRFGTNCIQSTGVGYWSLINNQANDCSGLGSKSLLNNTHPNAYGVTGIGANADVPASSILTNATALGYQALVNASDRVWLGNANLINGNVWSYGSYNTVSDGRFKSNISESDVKGLEFIKLLRPVVYNFESQKAVEFMCKGMPDSTRKIYLANDFSKSTSVRQSGFIAQEVVLAAQKSGYDFNGVHTPADDHDTYGIAYAQLVVPLVKAVQEQQVIIEKQKAESQLQIQDLQKQLDEQKQLINTLSQKTTGINSTGNIETGFQLSQNEPNPFTHETVIKYILPQTVSNAFMAVYDLTGKQIATFPVTEKGNASLTITSEKLAAGIYIYSIVADGTVIDSKRMIVAEK